MGKFLEKNIPPCRLLQRIQVWIFWAEVNRCSTRQPVNVSEIYVIYDNFPSSNSRLRRHCGSNFRGFIADEMTRCWVEKFWFKSEISLLRLLWHLTLRKSFKFSCERGRGQLATIGRMKSSRLNFSCFMYSDICWTCYPDVSSWNKLFKWKMSFEQALVIINIVIVALKDKCFE